MGKFCSWCSSCCCSSSSSSPREGTPQQPPNAGPSTSTSSSQQPPQQPANAGTSTSSWCCLPPREGTPQQPPNAGTSTTTAPDLMSLLHQFNDISKLHDLIKWIEDQLKKANGEKGDEGCSSQLSSCIQDGQKFLDFADEHIGKLPGEMKSVDGLSAEIINLLKEAGKIHWVGAALSVVGFVLARFNEMSDNKRKCLEILKGMFNLGKQIKELNEEMPEQKQKLMEAVACIVEGCIISASQLKTTKFFRFKLYFMGRSSSIFKLKRNTTQFICI